MDLGKLQAYKKSSQLCNIYIFCDNITQRVIGGNTYNLVYDAENHLTQVTGAAVATFVYYGDGKRVKAVLGGVTTTYIGNYYEWTGSTATIVSAGNISP